MTENVYGTFISEKPNKIRWKPQDYSQSRTFLTGSWDNSVNSIKLWSYGLKTDDFTNSNNQDFYPRVLKNLPFAGDVTELKFLNSEIAVASSSLGYVMLIKVKNDSDGTCELSQLTKYKKLHYFNECVLSPCTALSIYDEDIITVGEDGRINLLNTRKNIPVQIIEDADSCSIKCVHFLKHNEALTGNMRGQMKIWDLRCGFKKPVKMFMLNRNQQVAATSLAYHPSQRHVVLAGSEDAVITVWDLRQDIFPVTSLNAHTGSVLEIQFHLTEPDKLLFSCSATGELWMWNSSIKRIASKLLNLNVNEDNIWLSSDLKEKINLSSLMPNVFLPTNSLDVNEDQVLCGSDNEAIYLITNIKY